MRPMTVKVVSFIGQSGTGKTTLIEKVITVLKERKYRVGAIKHDAHRFDIDHPGKDSHRFTAAGADTMLICSSEKLALVKRHDEPPAVEDLLAGYFSDVDIVLTEGFKKSTLPKIVLCRGKRAEALLFRGERGDATVLAVAGDEPLETDVPLLDINDAGMVADFIEEKILESRRS